MLMITKNVSSAQKLLAAAVHSACVHQNNDAMCLAADQASVSNVRLAAATLEDGQALVEIHPQQDQSLKSGLPTDAPYSV